MPSVRVRENESPEGAIRRFKRACEKAGLTAEMRRHEFYEKPAWIKKRKIAQARKRLLKKLSREKMQPARGARSGAKKKVVRRRRDSE